MLHKKIETIDFKTFLGGKRIKEPKRLTTNVFSIMPTITFSDFFNMQSDVFVLYALVLGAGAVALLSYCLEVLALRTGHEMLAEAIETITRLSFTASGFGIIVWFLFSL